MQENQNAQIQLLSFQASEVKLSSPVNFDSKITTDPKLKINLQHRSHTILEDKKIFILEFDLKLSHDNFSMEVIFKALFSNSFEIDNAFLETPFVKLNAPAIVFPFLRSFVTTVTANAGYNPLILPAVNFAKFIKANPPQN